MQDSSPFRWLEDRGPACQLIALIDDATSRIWARFAKHDSTEENQWGLSSARISKQHFRLPNSVLDSLWLLSRHSVIFPIRRQRSGEHHRERKVISVVPPRASLAYHGRPACWYEIDPTMRTEYVKFTARTIPFLRIITLGIVFAFLYFASSVIVTMLLSILLAYFLDPVVEFLERMHVPRGLGALVVLLAVMSFVAGLGFLVAARANQFVADWPRYSAILRHAATAVDRKLATVENQVEAIAPDGEKESPPVRSQTRPARELLFLGVGSLYSIFFVATFLPFLVFFMLAAKPQIWKVTMELFPSGNRTRVKEALDQVNTMLRSYLIGNALVALILMLVSWTFFLIIHLDYPFLAGCVSGLLNLVPYLGVVLAWVPPFFIGMVKWNTIGPYLGIAVTLLFLHIIGLNVLMPAIVGRRVHLNPLAVTIALLLWGWLWGAIGLILAIPITATVKVVCDHVEGWEPAGRWLGS